MYSAIDDRSNFPLEPLLPNEDYYLVDCFDPIAEYMQVPHAVRMHMATEGEECTGYDMLDVELTELVEHLTYGNHTSSLERHTDHILDESLDHIRNTAKEMGIPPEDWPVYNTPIQKAHADALMQLGDQLAKVFKQFGFYDDRGHLKVDYDKLLPNGLVVFRKSERSFD